MLVQLSERFISYPYLLQILTQPSTLQTLLGSIMYLESNLALSVVQILFTISTHTSKIPIELLDLSSEPFLEDLDL